MQHEDPNITRDSRHTAGLIDGAWPPTNCYGSGFHIVDRLLRRNPRCGTRERDLLRDLLRLRGGPQFRQEDGVSQPTEDQVRGDDVWQLDPGTGHRCGRQWSARAANDGTVP